jgi:hypothetical protein
MRRWLVATVAVASIPLWLPYTCPIQRLLITADTRTLIELKNRTSTPAADDYDTLATLPAMLARGSDERRWSEQRAAAIDGYLVRVVTAGMELANCLSFFDRDVHLEIAARRDAPAIERLIAEVTPPMRRQLRSAGVDWSHAALASMIGKRLRVQGWLMFDREHADESENLRPGEAGNWRATAWEIHPVTSLQVLD